MHRICFNESDNTNDIIALIMQLAHERRFFFRGYNSDSEIYPGILRGGLDLKEKEELLLQDFEKYGSHYFQANSTIDFLSSAQHYGLPTRLLDFTNNPFIALSFALFSRKEKGDYYHILYADIDKNVVLKTIPYQETLFFMTLRTELLADKAALAIKEIEKIMASKDKTLEDWIGLAIKNGITKESKDTFLEKVNRDCILFIDPNQSNQRMMVQQGVFMLPYCLEDARHKAILENNCSEILIHKNHRKVLLEYIEAMGFDSIRLMPDLANVCRGIKKRYTEI